MEEEEEEEKGEEEQEKKETDLENPDKNLLDASNYYKKLSPQQKTKLSNVVKYINGQKSEFNEEKIKEFFRKLDSNPNSDYTIDTNKFQDILSVVLPNDNHYYISEIMKQYGQQTKTNIENAREQIHHIDSKEELMKEMNHNSNDGISQKIFFDKMMKGKYTKDDITELKDIFQLFDTDKDNKLSYQDFGYVMEYLGESALFNTENCKNVIRELKEDKNGNLKDEDLYITFDEFVDLVKDEY